MQNQLHSLGTYEFKLEVPMVAWVTILVIITILIIVLLTIIFPVVLFKIVLSDNEMIIGAPLTPSIKINRDDIESIALISLSEHQELKPTLRLFGVGLPGLKIGWFKLSNGKKAFLAINKWGSEALIIELKDGNLVILSPKDFNDFKSKLKLLGWIKSSS